MNSTGNFLFTVCSTLISICSVSFSDEHGMGKVIWIVQGGIKHGNIAGRNQLDGVSGATKTLWNASACAEFMVGKLHLETGFILGQTDQHIDYYPTKPERQSESGEKNISLFLLDVPVLYNVQFFPVSLHNRESCRLVVGIGAFASFVLSHRIVSIGSPTMEKLSNWALGPFFRFSYFPVELKGLRPGLYCDIYRSFLPKYFYDQPYFKQNGTAGQLGMINIGISMRFGQKA
jgi:hypothetical protein